MRFSPQLLDEIRARLPVSQLVSRHVRLKRAGREFVGLSPFKQEKTPSFTVNDEKGFYHCFATGEHGDIFTFLIKVEGISFPEAVEKLAAETGVDLPQEGPGDRQRADQAARLREVMEASCVFFQQALKQPLGQGARDYLRQRGLDEATWQRFRLGYAPNGRDGLKKHLLGLGFSLEELVLSGMSIGGRDISVPYDRFRDRLMFPIEDMRGKVIAFGGRALNAAQKAKYLNSPETPLFHKGRLLYNAARARQSAYEREMVIAVEGYMDAIACAGAGFDNVVAPLGTALTVPQVQLLWRMAPEPVLCFDGDEAGRKAAWRAVNTILPELAPGFSLRFAFLPEGQDPDDLIRGEGAQAFGQIIAAARPLVDVLWQHELQQTPTDTPERRASFESRLYGKVGLIGHATVKSHYEKEMRQRLWSLWKGEGRRQAAPKGAAVNSWKTGRGGACSARRATGSWSSRNKGGAWFDEPRPASDKLRQSALVRGSRTGLPPREALLLEAVLNHPWLLEDYSEEIAALDFTHKELLAFRDAILQVQIEFCDKNPLDREALRVHLKENGFGDILEKVGAVHIGVDRWVRSAETPRLKVVESWQQMLGLYLRQISLRNQLDEAEKAFLNEASEENFVRVCDLRARYLDRENMFARSGEEEGGEDNSAFFSAMLAAHNLK